MPDIDPIPAPVPAPQPAAPLSNSPDLDPTVRAVASPGAPDAGQQKPSFWKTLLMGAMSGLAGSAGAKSFGAGAAGGAAGQFAEQQRQIENARENARTQSDIKFRDAQSANAAANATAQQIANEQAPEEFRMKRDEFALKYTKDLQNDFGISFQAIPATSSAAMQYLTQLSNNDPNGAHVPDGIVTSPSTIFIPQPDNENGPLKDYNLLQKASVLYGLPDPGRNNYMAANPQNRRLMSAPVQNLMQGHSPDGKPLTSAELPGAIADLEGRLKKYADSPNADPKMRAIGQNTLDLLKAQKAAYDVEGDKKLEREIARIRASQKDSRGDRSYQFTSTQLDKWGKPVDDAVSRLGRLQDTLDQNSPQADALVAPELLTVMAGGQGSGLRMNEAEIARIIGGRSKWESLQAAANKWSTDPKSANSITPEQRNQIRALAAEVKRKLSAKQTILDNARQSLIDADDPKAHRQIIAGAHQQLTAVDQAASGPKVGAAKAEAAQQTEPLYAVNPQTKQRIVSNDGGKTWQPTQ